LHNLGAVYCDQVCWQEAIECFQESVRIKRAVGDQHSEAETLVALGSSYCAQNRADEAIECLAESIRIKRNLGEYQDEWKTMRLIGVIYSNLGQTEMAITAWRKSLDTLDPNSPEYRQIIEWLQSASQDG
jgi:tetratricopeptide (TPR) repeat protein